MSEELEYYKVRDSSHIKIIKSMADRIAELEKQGKPVAWIRSGDDQLSLVKEKNDGYMVWKPLYLAPQTKPLSDDEIWEWFEKNTSLTKESALMIGRAIEAKVRG
jgi:hypothetical protein